MKYIPTVLVGVLCALQAGADHWPQWRGPTGTGVSIETGVLSEWGPEKNVRWRTPLPEAGNSTPVVWGDTIFLTQPESGTHRRTLMSFHRPDGKLRWQEGVTYGAKEPSHATNPYCSPSPATDGERVVVWFGSAGLFCYDMEGKELWRRDLGLQEHMWGHGTSPILFNDLCILNFGPGKREMLIAVNKKTGEDAWRVDSIPLATEIAFSGAENNGNAADRASGEDLANILRGSWSTPIVIDTGTRKELVVSHPRRITAYDPTSGSEFWTCGGYAPLAYVSPVFADGAVVALGGWFGASLAVKVGGSGDVTGSRTVWHKPRDGSYLGTGVAHEDHLYVASMEGLISCTDVRTGEQAWEERLESSSGRNEVWSSITMSGDGLMYVSNQAGDTFVFRPNPRSYDQVARNSIDEHTNSSVVIGNGDIFIRTHQALWCFAKQASP
jgi:outer membrane protein assembly factor BamB